MLFRRLLLLYTYTLSSLHALSISEMRESLSQGSEVQHENHVENLNDEMEALRDELRSISEKSRRLFNENGAEDAFEKLRAQSRDIRDKLKQKENEFRALVKNTEGEPFSLMHEKEVSLERLITDYASSNYLYVIPPEMAKIQLHLCSSLSIPKASWEEIIEIICIQNGIGIKQVNSFVKTLYWTLGNHTPSLKHIINQRDELELITPHEPVCYIFALRGSEVSRVHQFLKRFVNERLTSIHTLGNQVLILGEAQEVKELAKLVEFIRLGEESKSYRLIDLENIGGEEAERIVKTAFEVSKADGKSEECPVAVLCLKGHLLLLGEEKDLSIASKMLEEISSQILSPDEMTLHWYTCQYSDPAELAALLQQVYQVISSGVIQEGETNSIKPAIQAPCNPREGTIPPLCDVPALVVNPKNGTSSSEVASQQNLPNFIVDGKTGMIIMAVKKVYLEQLKTLAKKLDVPKKMVEIEVLLFEKKILDQTQFGLNLLKLGDNVRHNESKMSWKTTAGDRSSPGILDYFLSRKNPGGSFPAFNFAYNFLSSQEDICIHSNPTITTINQTQATIDLVEEQSINMGTVEDPRTSVISNTYVRAQYGIIIQITPTINYGSEDNDFNHYVTLETDIIFDTTSADKNNRPDISRRHIQNQVRIADGETLILGGLRRKNTETQVDKIPFIGDIPGFGKLFSYTSLDDKSTEMFILITPRIVEDQMASVNKKNLLESKKRPGDTSELLQQLLEAKEKSKEKLLKSSFDKMLSYGNR